MKLRRVATLLAVIFAVAASVAVPARAGVCTPPACFILYENSAASASVGTPGSGILIWPAPATGYGPLGMVGGLDGGPLSLTIPGELPGYITVKIDDCCLVGDIYEATVGSTPFAPTSIVPLGGPTLSTGTSTGVSLYSPPGPVAVNVTDLLLSYIGAEDPWGGGVVPDNYTPAGFALEVDFTPVPEPGTLLLLGTGVLGLGGLMRRKLNM
jgi:PEP-CTERM motif